MINFKTTKWNLVSVDLMQECYERNDVCERDSITEDIQAYLNIWRDYIRIDQTLLSDNQISYILGDNEREESFSEDEKKEKNKFKKDMEDFLKTHHVIRFKVTDMYSSWMYIRTVNDWDTDANGFLIGKQDLVTWEQMKQVYNFFRAYIEWTFFNISVFTPKEYIASNGDKIIEREYQDWWRFYTSEESALMSYDSRYYGDIIKESEFEKFEQFEKYKRDN